MVPGNQKLVRYQRALLAPCYIAYSQLLLNDYTIEYFQLSTPPSVFKVGCIESLSLVTASKLRGKSLQWLINKLDILLKKGHDLFLSVLLKGPIKIGPIQYAGVVLAAAVKTRLN